MSALIVTMLVVNIVLVIALLLRSSSQNKDQDRVERLIREEIGRNSDEVSRNLNTTSQTISNQIISLTQINEQKLEKVRDAVQSGLKSMQDDNSQKLEKMRETVDEKLHSTLEKRLGESFKMVSDRLEKVHQGLGDMQTLALGVGDLKKVLSNVKTR